MEELVELLIEKNYSFCSIESFTVGNFAAKVGSIPGVSAVYRGSLVSYQNSVKRDVLGIDQQVIDNFGVVSKEIAGLMAIRGKTMFQSDVSISFTGNAGPEPMENKPVGMIYMGIAYFDSIYVAEYQFDGTRQEIVNQAVEAGKNKLLEILK